MTNTRGIGFYASDGTKNPRAWIQQVTAADGSSQYMSFASDYSAGSTIANWNFIAGNVGIGTTGPGTKLDVWGTAGANDIFNVASSTGTSVLRITTAGNVGIGTTAPGTNRLEVVGGPIKATGGLIIETRTSDPASPVAGQIWLRTDLP